MLVFIQLTTAGAEVGPFDIYSYTAPGPFILRYSGIDRTELVDGNNYDMPDDIDIVRLQSSGLCDNYLDLEVVGTTTTTTTTTSSTTTTTTTEQPATTTSSTTTTEFVPPEDTTTSTTTTSTSTTTSTTSTTTSTTSTTTSSTTTTTTTTDFPCHGYNVDNYTGNPENFNYVDCNGDAQMEVVPATNGHIEVCGRSYTENPNLNIEYVETCVTTTTSSTTTTTTTIPSYATWYATDLGGQCLDLTSGNVYYTADGIDPLSITAFYLNSLLTILYEPGVSSTIAYNSVGPGTTVTHVANISDVGVVSSNAAC